MTEQEIAVIDQLGKAMNEFAKLPILHQADQSDFAYAIHLCQNIVFARSGMREYGWREGGILKRTEHSIPNPLEHQYQWP